MDISGMKQPYHLVDPSPWPLVGALGGGIRCSASSNAAHGTADPVHPRRVLWSRMALWWRDVLRESKTPGLHTAVVRLGLRYGMTLFIASEVMFFVGFFWAYFHFALYPEHVLGTATPAWPPVGRAHVQPVPPAAAQHADPAAVRHDDHLGAPRADRGRPQAPRSWRWASRSCSACRSRRSRRSNIPTRRSSSPAAASIPSVFFLATGFHGFHVIVGTIFLIVCWFRARGGEFTPQRHFGFEAAAWYWHFVDVVWLFLFVCIYLGGRRTAVAE